MTTKIQTLSLSKLDSNTNLWYTTILTALASYAIMILLTIPAVESYTPGLTIPDLLPMGYTSGYLYEFLTVLGEQGRQAYLVQLAMDLIYPFTLGLSFYLGFRRYTSSRDLPVFLNKFLLLLPWSITLFDYSENITIFTQILFFPQELKLIGFLAPIFSVLKTLSNTVAFTAVLVILVVKFVSYLRQSIFIAD